jgi:hypothetical protein
MGEVSRLGRDVVSRLVPGSRERFLVAHVAGSVALQRCNCALCTAGASHHMTICSSEGRDNTGQKFPTQTGRPTHDCRTTPPVGFLRGWKSGTKRGEIVNHLDFDPYVAQERRQQMLREVNSLRLEKRLRDNSGSSSSRFFALARRSALPLLRGAGLTK